MAINILGDENSSNKKQVQQIQPANAIKDNSLVITIALIMGAVLIFGLWFASTPCPDCPSMNCANVTIPECPKVTIPECPACNPVLACDLNETEVNITCENTTATKLLIFNSTSILQNVTIQVNSTVNRTEAFNLTELGMSDLIRIGVLYE